MEVGTVFRNISPDLVWSGRMCPANLGVPSCLVRKLICSVRSSPRVSVVRGKIHIVHTTQQMHHHKSTISEHDVMFCTTITALGVCRGESLASGPVPVP